MLQILNIGASAQEMKSVGSDLQSKMESSLRSVGNITSNVAEIKSKSERQQGKVITDALSKLSSEIGVLTGSSKTVEEKFRIIYSLTDNVRNNSASLYTEMNESRSGGKNLIDSFATIDSASEAVKNSSRMLVEKTDIVSDQMSKLGGLTENISVSMNGINDSTADINEAVKNAAMISDQNQNRIDSLYSEIRKFKV